MIYISVNYSVCCLLSDIQNPCFCREIKWALMQENLNLLYANNKDIDLPGQSDQLLCYWLPAKNNIETGLVENFNILASLCS